MTVDSHSPHIWRDGERGLFCPKGTFQEHCLVQWSTVLVGVTKIQGPVGIVLV